MHEPESNHTFEIDILKELTSKILLEIEKI